MSRDLEKEIRQLRIRTSKCLKETNLALRHRPTLILALLGLQLNLRDIHKARDPAKRGALIKEFDQAKTVIQNFLDRGFQQTGNRSNPPQTIRPNQNQEDQQAA